MYPDGKSPSRAIPYAANSSFGRLEQHGIPSAIRGCLSSGLGQRNVDTGLSSGALLSSTGEFAPGITEPGESGAFQPSSMNDKVRSAELGSRGRPYNALEKSRPGGFAGWLLSRVDTRSRSLELYDGFATKREDGVTDAFQISSSCYLELRWLQRMTICQYYGASSRCSRRNWRSGYRRDHDLPMHFKGDRLSEEWSLPGISAYCAGGLL
ncbi:hypothetical protein RSAG8_12461, partial [Rhizoctonia solani AG-8 WAC10335]